MSSGYSSQVSEASLVFSAGLKTVRDARRFLARTLEGWGCDDYDFAASVVLSELATNAALHARTPYRVRLRLETTHLAISVADANPQRPQLRRYALDATTGRGMNLIEALCTRWGTTPTDDGKTVWAHVRPDDSVALTVDVDELGEEAAKAAAPPWHREAAGGSANQVGALAA